MALLRQYDFFNLIQSLDPALHLRGLGGMRFETIDKALLLGQHRLLPREGRLLIGFADGAFTLIEIVVSRIADNLASVDFSDLRNQAIHEFAIVRCHQKRALIRP